jgi:uncharacterized protein YjiS (DUF1127 family)
MSSVKHFYRPGIASRAYWPRQSDRRTIIYRPFDDGRPSSAIGAQRRRPSAFRKSVVRAGTHVAYLAGHAFPNLLLAAGSWVVAEVLAGCATYAEAMYCIPPGMLDHPSVGECAPSGLSLPGHGPARRKPDLLVILGDGRSCAGPPKDPSQAACDGSDRAAYAEQPPAIAAGWRIVIAAPAVRLMAKWQRAQSRRQALAELRNLDERSLRDIGLTRCDIECAARHGIYLG